MGELEEFKFNNNDYLLFEERENFIKENYPIGQSKYKIEEIINSSLDGMKVIEERGRDGRIDGLITYFFGNDNKNIKYCGIGVMVVSEEMQGEGIMQNLFFELKNMAQENGCKYLTALSDSEKGENFLEKSGFELELDPVNSKEYYRMNL